MTAHTARSSYLIIAFFFSFTSYFHYINQTGALKRDRMSFFLPFPFSFSLLVPAPGLKISLPGKLLPLFNFIKSFVCLFYCVVVDITAVAFYNCNEIQEKQN